LRICSWRAVSFIMDGWDCGGSVEMMSWIRIRMLRPAPARDENAGCIDRLYFCTVLLKKQALFVFYPE
jgi:hypothetical protein